MAAESVSLQLLWKHQFQFAGYYIAREKGFYAEEGFELEIREFPGEIDLAQEVTSGRATFAVGRSSLLIDRARGEPVVAMMAAFQQSPLMLLTRADQQIDTAAALAGKRIMMTPDARLVADILAMLLKNGITLEEVEQVPHSFNLNDLIEGNTDAYGAYISNEPFQLEQQDIPYRVIHPRDYGFDLYSDILFTSEDYAGNQPQRAAAFLDATRRGWEYAFANIEETAQLIFDHYNSQNRSLPSLIFEGKALKELAYAGGG